jgi:hypothetical protein
MPQVVQVEVDRDRITVGEIRDLVILLTYSTGLGGLNGVLPLQLTGTILPPILVPS